MAKTWDFTINNYTEADEAWLKTISAETSRIVATREVGEEEKTPHIQGRVTFRRKYTLKALKKMHNKAHWEPTKCPQDFFYPFKIDSEVLINVDNRQQGKREDLKDVASRVVHGSTSVDMICMTDPVLFHQYGRTLMKVEDVAHRSRYRTWMTSCDWVWGETGVGKSHYAFRDYNPASHFVWVDDNGWWDGYNGHEVVIINEFRGQIPYCKLLELIDKWPCTVRVRNRAPFPFLAKRVIITSSMPPELVYKHLSSVDQLEQLLRRINIIHMV